MKSFKIISRLLIVLLCCSPAFAAVPNSMNFQGILRDSTGNPVADSSYSVTFNIYDAPTEGNLIWQETQTVSTMDGLFNVLLGTFTPIDETVIDGNDRYVVITVGGGPEITPRTQLVSVPYSHRVATVDGATGGTINSDLSVSGDISGGKTAETWFAERTGSVLSASVGMTTIPGLSITFTLSRPATVQMVSTGTQRFAGGSVCQVGLGFKIDGLLQGHPSFGQRLSFFNGETPYNTWALSYSVSMAAGTHTIEVQADENSGSGTCVICGEGDGSTASYMDCHFTVTAFYQ